MEQHHVAIWVSDPKAAAEVWRHDFNAAIGELYRSQRQVGFTSRFATLGDADLRIKLMAKPGLPPSDGDRLGWAHIAISLGSSEAADAAAEQFEADGRLLLGPRTTGESFDEAMVRGPDNLPIEFTV